MTEGILDIVVLVIVIAIVIGVGFGLMIPVWEDSKIEVTQQIYDKSIEKSVGESVQDYGTYDGSMNKLEVVLATQVMDFGSPEPRTIKAGDKRIDITSTYRYDLENYGKEVWNSIKNDAVDSRYKYEFYFGNPSTTNDDAYNIVNISEEQEE